MKEHWYGRHRVTDASRLSEFMAATAKVKADVVYDYLFFPVCDCATEYQRKRTEMNMLAYLQQGQYAKRCLNNIVPHGKRLRHRPYLVREPVSAAVRQPAEVALHRTLDHISSLRFRAEQAAELHKMSLRKLQSLRGLSSSNSYLRTAICETINAKITDAQKPADRSIFVVPFSARRVDFINFKRLIRRTAKYWPLDEKHLKTVMIARKLNPEVGLQLRNHVEVSLAGATDAVCQCGNFPDHIKSAGHVCTVDHAAILAQYDFDEAQCHIVSDLFTTHGSKFRFAAAYAQTEKDLVEFATAFAIRCAKKEKREIDTKALERWIGPLKEEFRSQYCGCNVEEKVKCRFTDVLQELHKHFVFTPCDKNPQSTAVWCKYHYQQTVLSAVRESFGEVVNEPATSVISRHAKFCQRLRLPAYSTLPYVYAMPKIHRLEPHRAPHRVIVGKSTKNNVAKPSDYDGPWPSVRQGFNSLSCVRKQLAKCLDAVIDVLVTRDIGQKIKRCWITRDCQEFIDSTANLQHPETMTTKDFSTMYTQLPHEDLIAGVCKAIDHAVVQLAKKMAIDVRVADEVIRYNSKGEWVLDAGAHYADRMGWSIIEIKQAVRFCVENAYVLYGDKLFRQLVGIGMGHEESPPLANLYLYSKENEYIDKKIAEHSEAEIEERFRGFRYHRRFIDDLFAPCSREDMPGEADYKLKIEVTGSGPSVVFLGVRVTIDGDRLIYAARDKQHAFDFKVMRFPSWKSTVPQACKRGCIMGMLCRTMNLTTTTKDFIAECRHFVRLFREREYPDDFIRSSVQRFLARNIISAHRRRFLQEIVELHTDAPILADVPAPTRETSVPRASMQQVNDHDTDDVPVVGEEAAPRATSTAAAQTDFAPSAQSSSQPQVVVVNRTRVVRPKIHHRPATRQFVRALVQQQQEQKQQERQESRASNSRLASAIVHAARVVASQESQNQVAQVSQSRPATAQELVAAFQAALELKTSLHRHDQEASFQLIRDTVREVTLAIRDQAASAITSACQALQASTHATLVHVLGEAKVIQNHSPPQMALLFEQLKENFKCFTQFPQVEDHRSRALLQILEQSNVNSNALAGLIAASREDAGNFFGLLTRLEESRMQMLQSSEGVMQTAIAQIAQSSEQAASAMRLLADRPPTDLTPASLQVAFSNHRDVLQHLLAHFGEQQEGLLQRVLNAVVERALSQRKEALPEARRPLRLKLYMPRIVELSPSRPRVSEPRDESPPPSAAEGSPPRTITLDFAEDPDQPRGTPQRTTRSVSPLPQRDKKSTRRERTPSPEPTPPENTQAA